jgi:hypothetical protein
MKNKAQLELSEIPAEFGVSDRSYRLIGRAAPLEYILPVRNTARFPLLHYDETKRANRSLRYSRNQKTPFEDEQDENPIITPVIFTDGFLSVPSTDPLLQWFLDLHPLNGKTFAMVDKKKEAKDQLALLDLQDEAESHVKEMTSTQRRDIVNVIFSNKARLWSDDDVLLQLRKYAKSNPEALLRMVKDPEIETKSIVSQLFAEKLLKFEFGKQVHMNTAQSKAKILNVPDKATKKEKEAMVLAYLKSEEGLDHLTYLEKELDNVLMSKKK